MLLERYYYYEIRRIGNC